MTEKIFHEIKAERRRQDEKWGIQNHTPITWIAILMEEVGEVSKEAIEMRFRYLNINHNYRKELIQVAAVSVAMIESYDRQSGVIE